MSSIFNEDFLDFLSCLEKNSVKYILVGGYSVVLHGYPRTTGDMDIWVQPTHENYVLLRAAFLCFGMPIMPLDDFLSNNNEVFTYGRPPQAIDIMTQCKGLLFDSAFINAKLVPLDKVNVRLIHLNDLITAKKSSGRYKDLDDLEHLQS